MRTATQKIVDWLLRRNPVKSNYEAANFSFDRSLIYSPNADARYDTGPLARLELMRRSRYFEKNNALPNKIVDLIETNVVGTGINPTPLTKSSDWGAEALQRWNEWVNVADISSRQDFYSLQAIIVRAQAIDGEIFVRLVYGETGNARLQLIESHRCVDGEAGPILKANPGWKQYDGIIVDQRGRPQYYLFSDDFGIGGKADKVEAVPAAQVVHFFEPSRAGQLRGITLFHSVLPTLHDLDDLQKYEMLAAKSAAIKVDVIKTESGELPSANLIGRSLQQPSSNGELTQDRVNYFERAFGGKTVALRTNESWEQSKNNRPSQSMREFWEYLAENVCKGVGVSFASVQDYKGNWGGAALRGAVTSDNRFYEIRTRSIASNLDRIWRHVIGTDIARRSFKSEIPADWASVKWQPPRRASVDIGYDSAATINDLRAGLRTFSDVIGEAGGDVVKVLTQRADEMKLCADLEKSRGLQPGTLSILFPNPPQVVADAGANPPGEKKP